MMDEKTWGIIIFGSLLVALGAFASYMEGRQRMRESEKKKKQPRRLRPSQCVHQGGRRSVGR